jgi:O-antigen/teichoic acid export membrane protein
MTPSRHQGRYSAARIRRALVFFIVGRGAQALTFLLLTLLLVRVLSARDYGAYMAVWGMVELMVPLSSFGLLEASRRYLPMLAQTGSRQAVLPFVRGVVLVRLLMLGLWAAVLALLWPAVMGFLGVERQELGHALAAAGAIAVICSVPAFRFVGEMLESLLEQKWSQLLHAAMPLVRMLGVAALMVAGKLELGLLLLLDAGIALLFLAVSLWVLRDKLLEIPEGDPAPLDFREVFSFSWHMTGVNLLQATASIGALRLLVARFLGLEAAGMFAFIQQLLLMVGRYMPAQVLASVVRPVLAARHARGEHETVMGVLELLWKANLLVLVVWLAAVGVSGDELMAHASGGRFPDTGQVMLLMLLGLGATTQGQNISLCMQLYGITRELRAQSVLFLLVPLGVVLGSRYGLAGVAAGIAITHGFKNAFATWWLRRQGILLAYDLRALGRIAVAMAIAVLLAAALHAAVGPWVALAMLGLFTVGALVLCKPLRESEFVIMSGLFKGRLAAWLHTLVHIDRKGLT